MLLDGEVCIPIRFGCQREQWVYLPRSKNAKQFTCTRKFLIEVNVSKYFSMSIIINAIPDDLEVGT